MHAACGGDEDEADGPPFFRGTAQLTDGGEHSFEAQPHVYYVVDRTSCEGIKDHWGGSVIWLKGQPPAVGSHRLAEYDANMDPVYPALAITFPVGNFASRTLAIGGTMNVTRSEGSCVSLVNCDVVMEGTFANVTVDDTDVVSSVSTGSFRCAGQ